MVFEWIERYTVEKGEETAHSVRVVPQFQLRI